MSTAGYLSLTESDRKAMLEAIGVDSIDALFEQIPEGVRLGRALDVPEALPEAALVRHLEELAGRNGTTVAVASASDLSLRLAEHLSALKVPAALLPAVLAFATSDVIENA